MNTNLPQPDSPIEILDKVFACGKWNAGVDINPDYVLTPTEALTKLSEYYTNKFLEIVGEDESEKKDGKLYTGYSNKDWDVIKVPNKSAIQRNKFRAKLRTAIKQLSKNSAPLNKGKGEI